VDNPHAERQAFVYCITCTVTGKRYFGICASKVQRRWRRHCNSAAANKPRNRNCPALHGAIRKYGEQAFTIKTIYEAVNWFEACKVERGLIAQHGTLAPLGYNLTSGGEGRLGVRMSAEECLARSVRARGRKLSAEHKAKLIAASKGRVAAPGTRAILSAKAKARMSSPEAREFVSRVNRGRKPTPEQLQKMAESQRGRKHSEETRAKMSAWQIGRKFSEETKQRISKARRRGAALRRNIKHLQDKAEALWRSGQTN
jgi:group I intron endonuclease